MPFQRTPGVPYRLYAQSYPLYQSGHYYYTSAPAGPTAAALGNGTVRVGPCVIMNPVTITRLGCEFTVAGEAASVYRLGVYADDGSGFPGTLLLDAGSISTGTGDAGTVATAGTPGVYDITVSLFLPMGLYWFGGVIQGAATTAPTLRCSTGSSLLSSLHSSTAIPTNASQFGWTWTGVSGALGDWFPPTGTNIAGNVPRLHFKVA